MSYFGVDRWMDKKILSNEKAQLNRYEYFDTEKEANEFIINRVCIDIRRLEKELDSARAKLKRVQRKFGDGR